MAVGAKLTFGDVIDRKYEFDRELAVDDVQYIENASEIRDKGVVVTGVLRERKENESNDNSNQLCVRHER